MKITLTKKIVIVAALTVALLSPYAAFANSNPIRSNVWNPTILRGPLVTCTGTGSQDTNPTFPACQSLCDLVSTFANVVYFFIGVVIWIIAPIMIAWSGITFMTSRGNTSRTSEARKMITAVAIGLLIVLCSYLIIFTFVKVLGFAGSVGGFGTNACPLQ
jgi:Mn2+/Fe2+ NRAMP family transporter